MVLAEQQILSIYFDCSSDIGICNSPFLLIVGFVIAC
jgi:hypothetical protein